VAKNIYQSHRNGKFDHPASMLPENAVRISEIASFELADSGGKSDATLASNEPIPTTVTLKSGEIICDIHNIIVATGYHITVPFLRSLHEDDTPATKASDTVLVTDGTQIHNLHKDIFYIPDPSLIFVGVPYFTATFSLFEFQALTITQVLSGLAGLPTEKEMRQEYRERVLRKGYGKSFHSLRGVEVEYVNELLDWVNEHSEARGVQKIPGHSEVWHQARGEMVERMKKMFEPGPVKEVVLPPCSSYSS
jgi:MFS transporter, ACS family, pantothenate transporter